MRLIDLRDPAVLVGAIGASPDETGQEDRSYLVLAPDATFRFRLDGGNTIPWSDLERRLEARLPHNGHDQLHDVSLGQDDVSVDARCGDETTRWICSEILSRGVVPPSVPVTLIHTSGREEGLGPLGEVARRSAPARRPS